MKNALLICGMLWLSVSVMAQDFASRFLDTHKKDTNLVCVTISPKMMEEIMKSDAEKDEAVLDILSNLKSMQMLTSEVDGKQYYNDALEVIKNNSGRFEPFLSFKDKSADCQIMIRKKKGSIVELVMLVHKGAHFTVINFTGMMSPEFISKLAVSMKTKNS